MNLFAIFPRGGKVRQFSAVNNHETYGFFLSRLQPTDIGQGCGLNFQINIGVLTLGKKVS